MVITQREWDEKIAESFIGSWKSTAKTLLWCAGLDCDEVWQVPERLAEEGLLRVPRLVSKHQKRWFLAYRNMPIRAWLNRAMPGSIDLFHEGGEHNLQVKSVDEIISLLEAHGRFKRLTNKSRTVGKGQARMHRASAMIGGKPGLDHIVRLRGLSKKHDWSTVK